MPRFDTILFDLDGTLLHTIPDMLTSLNRALRMYGRPERTLEDLRRYIGNGVRKLVSRALPDGENDPLYETIFAEYSRWYVVHSLDTTTPYDGILPLLEELRARGISLCCVTNKPHSDAVPLIMKRFNALIPCVVGKKEGRQPKPAPDAVEEALSILGAKRETTLYVGDSEVDYETAENTGLSCVLVSWGYRNRDVLEKLPALGLIDRPEELLRYILVEN